MTVHPEVLWAQRSSAHDEKKNVIYLTVNLPDIQEGSLKYDLTSTSISFEARAGNASKGIEEKDYKFFLEFYAEVDPKESTMKLTSRSFSVILRKKEVKLEYWPRLTKDKVKNAFVKTDFGQWVDEDEQEGTSDLPEGMDSMTNDMDFGKMMADFQSGPLGGNSGQLPGGAEGGEDSDSDDDGPPPLEDVVDSK